MADHPVKTVTLSTMMRLEHKAVDIWPLLCPVREYDWIDVWKCEMLHSVSGVNELGCVFRTNFPADGEEVWVTSRFEPVERLEFVLVSKRCAVRYAITLLPDNGATRMVWTHHITPLDGKDIGVAVAEEAFRTEMASLEAKLRHYLDTGRTLTGQEEKGS
ncbi:hypothetical protein [Pseudodesulfovibrio pelocollis]|uniref:hypothetical protein n=1 Tax=Pseudodesulfovibrio pelocollis TaxID=3051432 RepID=UPI00255B1ED1|nr:hypothetical protein [Pseudodesulfovibrio sp. SB368]